MRISDWSSDVCSSDLRIRKSLISSSPMEAPMRATPRIDTSRFCPLSSTEALLAAPPEPPEPTVGPEGSVLPPSMTVEAKSPMPPVKNEPRLVTVSPRNVAVVDPASVKVRTKPARTLGCSGKPPPHAGGAQGHRRPRPALRLADHHPQRNDDHRAWP